MSLSSSIKKNQNKDLRDIEGGLVGSNNGNVGSPYKKMGNDEELTLKSRNNNNSNHNNN